MNTISPRLAAALAVAALALAACGENASDGTAADDRAAAPGGAPTLSDLDGRVFVTTGADSLDADGRRLVAGTTITLGFQGSDLRASAGCNSLMGTAEVEDGTLTAGRLAGTEMACEPDLMAQDDWLADFLAASPEVTLADGVLTLAGDDATLTLTDEASGDISVDETPLEGTIWELQAITESSDSSASGTSSSAYADVTITIADGDVEVEGLCNSAGASAEVDGERLKVGDLASTLVDCGAAERRVDKAVLAVLAADPEFDLGIGTLALTDPDTGRGLDLAAR